MLTTSGPAPPEVWRWQLEPDEEYPSHPHQAGVVETVSVTSGRMTLVVDSNEHAVEALAERRGVSGASGCAGLERGHGALGEITKHAKQHIDHLKGLQGRVTPEEFMLLGRF